MLPATLIADAAVADVIVYIILINFYVYQLFYEIIVY